MAKDPAVLIYYKDIQMSTRHWDADIRGWYFSLLMEQADKPEGLPNDLEELSVLAGVKPSKYERFTHCWQNHIDAMFELNEAGLLVNKKMEEVIDDRSNYKKKQALRGSVGAMIKKLRGENKFSEEQLKEISKTVMALLSIEATKEDISKAFKRTLQAYGTSIIVDAIANVDGEVTTKELGGTGGKREFELSEKITIPPNVLELAELNQFTFTKSRNTEFIKDHWRIFLHERMHDPPGKKLQYRAMADITSYFLNWIRTKHPKNAAHQQTNGHGSSKLGTGQARTQALKNF